MAETDKENDLSQNSTTLQTYNIHKINIFEIILLPLEKPYTQKRIMGKFN